MLEPKEENPQTFKEAIDAQVAESKLPPFESQEQLLEVLNGLSRRIEKIEKWFGL